MSGQESIPKIMSSPSDLVVPSAMKGIVGTPENTVKKSGKTVAFRNVQPKSNVKNQNSEPFAFNTSYGPAGQTVKNTKAMWNTLPASGVYTNSGRSTASVSTEISNETSRLEQLDRSKNLKEAYAKYDQDVNKYFNDLMKSMSGKGDKSDVVRRFNDMISDSMFKGDKDKLKELGLLKQYMQTHKWASLGNIEEVIESVYKSKLMEIENLMNKMKYDPAKKRAVKLAIGSIIKQAVSSQVMTFQYIYAQFILYKTMVSYVSVVDNVESAINSAVAAIVQPNIQTLNKQQQNLVKTAISGIYKRLGETKQQLSQSVSQ